MSMPNCSENSWTSSAGLTAAIMVISAALSAFPLAGCDGHHDDQAHGSAPLPASPAAGVQQTPVKAPPSAKTASSSGLAGPSPAPPSQSPLVSQARPPQPPTTARGGGRPAARTPATKASVPLKPPPIEFRPATMDFGVIRPGQLATGSVQVVNTSDRPILIEQSKASCTCTSVDLANTILQPGEGVPLTAQYKGSNYLGVRKLSVKVKVAGNYDMAEVPLRAFVALPVRSDPPIIKAVRDQATGQAPLQGLLTITSEDNRPFRILGVQGETPPFADFDPAVEQPRNHYQLKWDLTGYHAPNCVDAQNRRMPGWLVIETDHRECPVFYVEVRHECTLRTYIKAGASWYVPERHLPVGKLPPGEPVELTIEIKWLPKSTHDDLITQARSESPQFAAELLDLKASDEGYEARVKITPAAGHRGVLYGDMVLQSEKQQWPLVIVGAVRE